MASNINTEPNPVNNKRTVLSHVWEWVKVIAVAMLISLPIRFFIAEPFIVRGQSMDPTFATNQFLIVDRLGYRFHNPSRGDVIIFKYPQDTKVYYIKRIIGLPGETLNMEKGVVTISSSSTVPVVLDEPYISPNHKSFDDFTVQLGSDEYFVMGDNRLESSDSRFWGPVKSHYIIGKPFIRLFPLTKLSIMPGEIN